MSILLKVPLLFKYFEQFYFMWERLRKGYGKMWSPSSLTTSGNGYRVNAFDVPMYKAVQNIRSKNTNNPVCNTRVYVTCVYYTVYSIILYYYV